VVFARERKRKRRRGGGQEKRTDPSQVNETIVCCVGHALWVMNREESGIKRLRTAAVGDGQEKTKRNGEKERSGNKLWRSNTKDER